MSGFWVLRDAAGLAAVLLLAGCGTGLVPEASTGAAGLTVGAAKLRFEDMAVGIATAAQRVSIENNGSSTVVLSRVTIAGTNAADFSVGACASMTLRAGASCDVGVVFAPTAVGARGATLEVSASGLATPQEVSMDGTGVAPAAASYVAFGDSITCGYVPGGATTPPFSIDDASCQKANGYPYLVAGDIGVPALNYGIPGDQACDIWVRQIAPQMVDGTTAKVELFSLLIGTNDVFVKGQGAYEANFNSCQQAAIAWIGTPSEYKTLPEAATVTGGGKTGSAAALGGYNFLNGPGSASYAITTYGGPIYLWHTIDDQMAGMAIVTVDGVAGGSISIRNATPIATQNGTSTSVGLMRMENVAAGVHTVTVTWVSGGVTVVGVGTPPGGETRPVVVVGSVPLPQTGYASANQLAAVAEYSADCLANVTLLAADGLDVRYAPNGAYLTGAPAQYTDNVHVTPTGAAALAAAFLAIYR